MNNINVLIFLLAVFLASKADSSRNFNLTGWFDTGFSIGHGQRRHRVHDREAVYRTDIESHELPSVAEVKHFKIPDVFTQAKSTRQAEDEPEDNNEVVRHHSRRHHGAHRH